MQLAVTAMSPPAAPPAAASPRRDALIELVKRRLRAAHRANGTPAARRAAYAREFAALEAVALPVSHPVFTALPLERAFAMYDVERRVSERRFVAPGFDDVRAVFNYAQCLAMRDVARVLFTFDGDRTLYEHGGCLGAGDALGLVGSLVELLERGHCVALVTAASYGNDACKYEKRLFGLLDALRAWAAARGERARAHLPNFLVMGGEANFLFRCNRDARLQPVAFEEFATPAMRAHAESAIQGMLDVAEAALVAGLRDLRQDRLLRCVRKPRAVGVVRRADAAGPAVPREVLDELAMAAKHAILNADPSVAAVPHCAFNGGEDCFVDVFEKGMGVEALQRLLGYTSESTCHIGDQFLPLGNDIATRKTCPTVWVSSPAETARLLRLLIA